MRRAAVLVVALAACDPVWSVHTQLRTPSGRPLEDATLALACPDDGRGLRSLDMMVRSLPDGEALLGGLGSELPVGCDVYVAKPGYRTHRVRYRELCPDGPDHCDRVFSFELVLEPE